MITYIFKKIVTFLFIICVLAQISFCLVYFVPHSTFQNLNFSDAYIAFFKQLLQGQFRLMSGETVPFLHTLLATFELCILALIVALLIGLPLGILLGLSNINWLNSSIRLSCLLFYSCPIVMLVVVVMHLISPNWTVLINYNVSPSVSGVSLLDIFTSSRTDKLSAILDQLHYLMLPTIILAIQPSIMTIQLISQNVKSTSRQNYIKMAIIRERSPFRVLRRHLLPNSIPNTIPQLTYNTTTLLFSTMVIEILFNRVGLGQWVMIAYRHHNYFIISIAILACGTVISLLTLLGEITAVAIYPLRRKEHYV
ncbi:MULTISPECIES: ABC transporter permease subunit [unclassified Gilliamella]|uniref:ABC transporter permease subunit n=1 Tax=unclassified Gilliamella TaxID=2685620 RepID=UPI001C6A2B77|nr:MULTISPECIES: ABC transporter permease subunit [unclassified Gilliamella]MCX8607950.1 ABC transporter permease subunit [Gilliamella sp. B3771]MCX8611115.1 ABC transporter permease subunit [Gilliamella sp. B3891]MCX8613544.1 ABC transporter permease subunit [Gilliamella sp. B3773]MCX8614422.1 ABC transporter permease subunit [Gilliamella sp. B3770]MCX8618683.1 ABC transporter permease subunit [Gilliamella sp. B2923]